MNNTISTSDTKQGSAITNFVIVLGRELLSRKVKDWNTMEDTARFCKQHSIPLNGEIPGTTKLESELRRFFKPTGEFYADNVNVDAYERPYKWDRPFMIRAFPYSPSPDCSNVPPAEVDTEQLDAAGLVTVSSN